MKKKLIIISAFIILAMIIIYACYKGYYKNTEWNYEGQAVILIANPPYDFVGTTNVKLDGEVYGFGKYYLGDVYFDQLEELSSYTGNNKVSTMYRYNLDTEGERYFENKEKKKILSVPIMAATYVGTNMPETKMAYFDWYEWSTTSEGKVKRKEVATSYFYMKKPGEMPCVLYLVPLYRERKPENEEMITSYFIVPGVSTREEAIAVLKENFEQLGMGNFIYY